MKYSKHLLLASLTAFLTACGGGGGDTSGTVDDPEPNSNEPELKIDFSSTKTEPKVFNPRAFGSAEKIILIPKMSFRCNITSASTTQPTLK